MEKPNYVLKANEAVVMPIEMTKKEKIIKTAIIIVLIVIMFGSFLLDVNLFSELPWTTRVLLIALVFWFFSYQKTDWQPSPMELQFYDEYLILYLPKRYISRRITRREYSKMKYSEITRVEFEKKSQRFHIYGDGVCTWYNYKKNDLLPEKPTKVNEFEGGMIYFNVRLEKDIDFIKEIETHSPLKVEVNER